MATSLEIRSELVAKLRRDLIGPYPQVEDADLAHEKLSEEPSRWYLTGFAAAHPADKVLVIVTKAARKMSADGRARALRVFSLPASLADAFRAA